MRALTLAAASLALAALLASPADAKRARKSAALKGQVVSAPYSGRGLTAVPVMLSKTSAKRAGLRSPVGVLVIDQRRRVAIPSGRVAPAQLRPGDQIVARIQRGAIGRSVRQSPYWRIPLRDLRVTVRTKTLSLDELQQMMVWIRGDLDNFAGWTVGQLRALAAQLEQLRGELAAVRAALAALGGVDGQLRSELQALTARVAELEATVDGLLQTTESGTTLLP